MPRDGAIYPEKAFFRKFLNKKIKSHELRSVIEFLRQGLDRTIETHTAMDCEVISH